MQSVGMNMKTPLFILLDYVVNNTWSVKEAVIQWVEGGIYGRTLLHHACQIGNVVVVMVEKIESNPCIHATIALRDGPIGTAIQ